MSWNIKKFDELTNIELYTILKERTDVFVVEQECPYPEVDGKDLHAVHLFKEDKGVIAAYLRILPAGVSYQEASLGRVLVRREFRGQGLARELVQRGLDIIRSEWKETVVKIQAQEHLSEFYGSFGFEAVSEMYLEDGIPHVDMMLQ